MPYEVSRVVPTALSSGAQKLGQPVRLSNFVVDENRSRSQPAQAKLPRRFSCRSGLVKGRSVALCRSTANWSGLSRSFQSASVRVTSNVSAVSAAIGGLARSTAPAAAAKPIPPFIMNDRLVIMADLPQSDLNGHRHFNVTQRGMGRLRAGHSLA